MPDDPSILPKLLVLMVLILVNAFFAAAMAQEGIGLAFTYRSCSQATPDVNLLSIAPEGKYVDLALAYPEGYRSKAARALGNLFHEHFS